MYLPKNRVILFFQNKVKSFKSKSGCHFLRDLVPIQKSWSNLTCPSWLRRYVFIKCIFESSLSTHAALMRGVILWEYHSQSKGKPSLFYLYIICLIFFSKSKAWNLIIKLVKERLFCLFAENQTMWSFADIRHDANSRIIIPLVINWISLYIYIYRQFNCFLFYDVSGKKLSANFPAVCLSNKTLSLIFLYFMFC